MTGYSLPTANGKGGFGWGICGDNLAHYFNKIGYSRVALDNSTAEYFNLVTTISGPTFIPTDFGAWGRKTAGIGFIEDNLLAARNAHNAYRLYENVVCGSTSMADELSSECGIPVSVVHQGLDHYSFNFNENIFLRDTNRPRPIRDKYTIGSYGKFEFRKGQDILIKAVAIHNSRGGKKIKLVCDWHNQWEQSLLTMTRSKYIGQSVHKYSSLLNGTRQNQNVFFTMVLLEAGLAYEDFEIIQPIDISEQYATKYNVDVAVFPNRKEAGTNLPLCEAIAHGTPCVYTNKHGHRDITLEGTPHVTVGAKMFTAMDGKIPLGYYYETAPEELLDKIVYTINNEKFEECREFGIKLANRWTWEKAAKNIENIVRGLH